jgi:hypothetical protein
MAMHPDTVPRYGDPSLKDGQDRLEFTTHTGQAGGCGRSAAGSASPCQGEGRGFESRRPLGGAGSRLASRRVNTALRHRGVCGDPGTLAAEWPSGLGKGLQSPVHGFDSRLRLAVPGPLAQWESASLTRKRSLVQIQYGPLNSGRVCAGSTGSFRHLSQGATLWNPGEPMLSPGNWYWITSCRDSGT